MARSISQALVALFVTSVFAGAVATSACSKDPFDPQTWIDKLDEPSELEEAITQLERLKCPQAIGPLGEVWKKNNKWSKVLRVMITLADQPEMKDGHPEYPNVDCKNVGEGPYWDAAIPYLSIAVEDFDVSDDREIEDAKVAAHALGKAKSPETIQILIHAATKQEKLRQGQMVRVAAIQALGGFGDNEKTVETLVTILQGDATLDNIRLHASAANALAATGSPKAVLPLLKTMFEVSIIYQQVRMALTTIGKPATKEIVKVFKGTQKEINDVAKNNKFATNCKEAMGPNTSCIAPGNLRYKSAQLLGDLRATEAIPDLLAALDDPEAISFFDPKTGARGPSDHNGILDSLRVMGAFSAAGKVGSYMKAESTNKLTRPMAVDVYSMLATGTKELGFLQKAFENQDNDMPMRDASTMAYARLVRKEGQLAPIQAIIDRQLDEAYTSDAKAKKAKTDKARKAAEGAAADYRGFARKYEQHRTRARAGIVCGEKLECYLKLITLNAAEVVKMLAIPNHRTKPMKKQDMQTYRIAALERALLEISKMGKKAEPALDALLKNADTTERIIRQVTLLALVQAAPKDCSKCATRLNDVIKAQSSQTTLDYLTADTKIVLNYFVAQGAKVESTVAPAAAPEAEDPAK